MLSAEPPPIPASHKAARWEAHAREHLMMWVHTGRAHVRLADGQRHRIDAGTGIWLPPGPDHDMWTDAGTVAVPLAVPAPAVPDAPDQTVRFAVDDGWRDWLIAQYAQSMRPPDEPGGRMSDLLTVLTTTGRPRQAATPDEDDRPVMPRTGAAAVVARALARRPSLDHTLEEWAVATACSPSTLRRQFHHDTGSTFAVWRTRWRLSAARDHLTAGGTVEDAAARAGFASRQSFARAFREHYGSTPRDHRAQAATTRAETTRHEEGGEPPWGRAGTGRDRTGAPPAPVPAQRSAGLAEWNELTWIYRGEARSRVADISTAARRGDALWLPAGTPYEFALPAGAIAVPVGQVCCDCAQFPRPLQAHFPPSWDTYLLHCSVSGNTLLHPTGYHVRHIVGVFDAQLAVERARVVPRPRDRRARAAADGFLRALGTAAEDLTHQVPPEVHAAFRRETGMSFASWRHAARMRSARDLLVAGTKPRAVSGRLGYRHVANFSRAFSRFHGMTPREWREHERGPESGHSQQPA